MNSVPLSQLDAEIVSLDDRPVDDDVLFFDCPICVNGSSHTIAVNMSPPPIFPSGALWKKVSGSTIDDITITPSINCQSVNSTCKFHGWVKEGKVIW